MGSLFSLEGRNAWVTGNYTFIWGMCGENDDYNDMDWCATNDLR